MLVRFFRRRFLVGVFVASLATAVAILGPSAEAVEVRFHNRTRQTVSDIPVTFAQVFRRGEVIGSPAVSITGERIPAQIDVKRRYDDGSTRLAIVSMVLGKELPPQGTISIELAGDTLAERAGASTRGRDARAELLKSGFDTVVRLTFPDGTVRSVSARKLLGETDKEPPVWLRGSVATEWLLSGPPVDEEGKADEDLNVQFQVRAYTAGPVRVSVVVENCFDSWAGNIRYDASISVAGKEVFSKQAVDHRKLSRWRQVFWHGSDSRRDPGAIHVVHDLAAMSSTGALPNYDRSLAAAIRDSAGVESFAMQGPRWEITGRGPLTAYMPTTGGRPEIAPYPIWTVRYLLGMDPAAKRFVLTAGDLAGSWPIHVRSRETGRIMTIDRRGEFWLDQRGDDRPQWKPDRHAPSAGHVRLTPDLAHQGSFAYVPYLVTGDYYYLEEAYFWANYCLLATWPHPRRDAQGILSGQIRGNAWALRNMADAAWIAAEGHLEADYFDEKIRNNLADRIRRMLGPPEYNAIGAWGIRTTQNARIHNPPNPDWMIVAPWEHDYLIWSLHHLVELGHADAAPVRDFLLRLRVGTLTHGPDFDPRLAAPYRFVVGQQDTEGKVTFYEDWKLLGRENARLNEPRLPDSGNDYSYSARAAVVCGVDGGFPKAAEALRWIDARFPDLRGRMLRNPGWAIVPREATGAAR